MDKLSGLRKQLRKRLREPQTFLAADDAAPDPSPPAPEDGSFLAPPQAAATSPEPRPSRRRAAAEGFLPPPEAAVSSADAAVPDAPAQGSFLAPWTAAADAPAGLVKPLTGLWPGTEIETARGPLYRLLRPGADIADDSPALRAAWAAAPRGRRNLHSLLAAPPERIAFLDIETCGLQGVLVFLVGLAWLGAAEVELEFLFARHAGEEPALLCAVAERLEQVDHLVTYNGATFDLPYLHHRRKVHKTPAWPEFTHVDLLPQARRYTRRAFGDCRLQTLERHLIHRPRPAADLPSAEVPEMYQRWTRTHDEKLLSGLLTHNGHDLLTMVGLVPALAEYPQA